MAAKGFSVKKLATHKDEGVLILQMDYQRKFGMNPKLSNRLIDENGISKHAIMIVILFMFLIYMSYKTMVRYKTKLQFFQS